MEKFFNIAGPCVAARHYMLPATARLPEIMGLVRRELYFVIHAPRQSGKTTALKQLVRDINGSGERVAMYCSLETLQNVTDVAAAMRSVETLVAKAMKISGSAQMSVGDGACAVPFVYAKASKGIWVTFVLWFDKATKALVDVTGAGEGVEAVAFGDAAAPAIDEHGFVMDRADVLASVPGAISNTMFEVKAAFDGRKFLMEKAAKVTYKKGVLTVDTSKGGNVPALTLKFSKGALSGGFTVYEVDAAKGKLVKNKFTVNGVVVDGVGYGLAVNKKLAPIAVSLRR